MGLFHLGLQIHGRGQALVHEDVQFRPAILGEVVFGFIHLARFGEIQPGYFHI
jgi:hypothetical protein